MVKQAPSTGRLIATALFVMSCFALLLFLWISFGGSSPLKPKGYRFEVAMPEGAQVGLGSDVRVSGVPIGAVREKRLAPGGRRSLLAIELDPQYAPLRSDARVTLRQKTAMGEAYLEMTLGSRGARPLPEGGRLADARVQRSVEFDEALRVFDRRTRAAYRAWQQGLALALRGRGGELNHALGNLPAFVGEGDELLQVLDDHGGALRRVVRDTGATFRALTADERALQRVMTAGERVFSATATVTEPIARTIQILPTFQREATRTLDDLRGFAQRADPVVADLVEPSRLLGPTVRDVRRLAPDLRALLRRLDPLLDASRRGLPALRDVLRATQPLLAATGPVLSHANPMLEWLQLHNAWLTDAFANPASATAAKVRSGDGRSTGHYLRQSAMIGLEAVALHPRRLAANRGNAYPAPDQFGPRLAREVFLEAFDCRNATPGQGSPCKERKPWPGAGSGRFPHLAPRPYR